MIPYSSSSRKCLRYPSTPVTHNVKEMSQSKSSLLFEKFTAKVSEFTAKPIATAIAFSVVLAWAISGPAFGYSTNWQIVINTTTTIVTFLMVFLLQNSQSRDTKAQNVKLDELLRIHKKAHNELAEIERPEVDTDEVVQRVKLEEGATSSEDSGPAEADGE
jgi:low affinity Fe/Cu permease